MSKESYELRQLEDRKVSVKCECHPTFEEIWKLTNEHGDTDDNSLVF